MTNIQVQIKFIHIYLQHPNVHDYEDFYKLFFITDWEQRYNAAKLSVVNRSAQVAAVIESLERDMELLCVTGVEDKLQDNVRTTLEQLRNAGLKIWMLTGGKYDFLTLGNIFSYVVSKNSYNSIIILLDKLETATCIAKSSRLVSKNQNIHIFKTGLLFLINKVYFRVLINLFEILVSNRTEAHQELNAFRRKQDTALVISGKSLEVCLDYYEHEFMELATTCPAVVCCRCTPEQKAQVVRLIQQHTGKQTAAIGDGGNDVSMIQAASAGVGIVGKEYHLIIYYFYLS